MHQTISHPSVKFEGDTEGQKFEGENWLEVVNDGTDLRLHLLVRVGRIIKIPYSGFKKFTTILLHFKSFVQLKVKQEKTFLKFVSVSWI